MSLSKAKRQHLERRLLDERARALRILGGSVTEHAREDEEDRTGDLTSMPLHPADLGTDTMQEELDASNSTRISRELAEIDAALERLYQTPQKFGVCEDTGRNIPFDRLEIIPWARTCEQADKKL
jgi:DnaK suppressor protein